ncbi:hypothetical protein ACEV6Q_04340 [Enterobacter ludwigii]|uniref:hypothetical protein n=1 Tax=Enterobacter ludwigii TaxID=299767 RepID=UPI003BEEF203
MQTFKNCTMDTYYRSGAEPDLDNSCEIVFEDKLIRVTYYYEGDKITYVGHEVTPGVYKLKGSDGCVACLYGTQETKVLYGGWHSPPYSGVWDIKLGASDDSK